MVITLILWYNFQVSFAAFYFGHLMFLFCKETLLLSAWVQPTYASSLWEHSIMKTTYFESQLKFHFYLLWMLFWVFEGTECPFYDYIIYPTSFIFAFWNSMRYMFLKFRWSYVFSVFCFRLILTIFAVWNVLNSIIVFDLFSSLWDFCK